MASPRRVGAIGCPAASVGFACKLYASAESATHFGTTGGQTAWRMFVPPSPALVGTAFYNQALVLDPAANPAGITASNAAAATIGVR